MNATTTEAAAPPDRRRCPSCGKTKPLGAFTPRKGGGVYCWCRTCVRVGVGAYQQTEAYREWLKAYLARDDVKARRAETDRKRAESRRPKARAYRATPRARILHCRRQARARLRAAESPEKRARLEALIASYDSELARIDREVNSCRRPN